MVIVETDRLRLRTLEKEDLDALMTIWGNEEVMKYCGGAGNREREERALKFYMNLQKEKGYSPYAVTLKENRQLIGVCGFNPPYDHPYMELMYHFSKEYWGKGYATEAAKACIHYAKDFLQAAKIVGFIEIENSASENVLRKLGFLYKGEKWHEGSQKKDGYFELEL